ncbi:MAG: type II 3-dehydroquinate dehydratase [Chloroflexi bacterium]|nr:type II 3-dehydroquinate dehydratase [Chloroflexota bacterium]MYK61905.1 type II 3-dehydroquinate dehydratase [Chloroflexota bacterium]
MDRILIINGPNLNNLGKRDAGHYGSITLADIEERVTARAEKLGVKVAFFQSNHEGAIVDWIQAESGSAAGIIINAGALTQVGYSILDALLDSKLPVVEVHISNIHAREEFRRHSVIAPYAVGQIAGLGYRGYIYALESLVADVEEASA